MSHTTTMEVRITDKAAFADAAKALGYEATEHASVKLYDGSTYENALAVNIPGWRYPVVVAQDGSVHFDNYGGAWGKPEQLDKLRHQYSRDLAVRDAKKRGYRVRESVNPDGSTELLLER